MAYSFDLRKRVVDFVKNNGSKTEAAKRFAVSKWCVYDWCKRSNLHSKKPQGRSRKSYWKQLEQDIIANPGKTLKERAHQYGVRINAVWYACKQLKITPKKTSKILRKKP